MPLELFPSAQIVGVFRGFKEGGMEFHADLVLPYRNEFQSVPMHGQFLLVQLETPEEAVLGRIASFSSEGKLAFGNGEEFNIRAVREGRQIPEDLREQYLKYKVSIRVLGVLRKRTNTSLVFVASHRRLPHVGSPVAFPSGEVLRHIAGHYNPGASLGHFALGEYIYARGSQDFQALDWMQIKDPEVQVRFAIENLLARRSFILARAGFGKSNLNKLLFSSLYQSTPTVTKRQGRQVPVGTVIFDPDGEYFWPDDKGRPGLCDVPHLEDKLVVFTSRRGPSAFYQSFVAGGIKLDIRRLRPADVVAITVNPDRQEQQNVRKLKGLDPQRWQRLVDLIDRHGNQADLSEIARLLDMDPQRQEAEALAARGNMTAIVRTLHDRSSRMMDMLIDALAEGKLCVIDVSQMRGAQAMMLSGLILRRIFDRNQEEFTNAEPRTIPTIAVVEEAQSVLVEGSVSAEPYIAWVKEGRKYDLGAVLITQQPGSIPMEILSQGDNWFIFHLLSAADLTNVRRANAHFSEDLLSALLNEPIPGQGVFWSSVGGNSYPVSVRVRSFESLYRMRDSEYRLPAARTFARELIERQEDLPAANGHYHPEPVPAVRRAAEVEDVYSEFEEDLEEEFPEPEGNGLDALEQLELRLGRALEQDVESMQRLQGTGLAWGGLKALFLRHLPPHLDNRGDFAYNSIPNVLTRLFGRRNEGWHTFKSPNGSTWIKLGRPGQDA
jgi:hypothetical protein